MGGKGDGGDGNDVSNRKVHLKKKKTRIRKIW